MRDHELYATILGVQAPWRVERVELDVPGGAVHVWLARDESAAAECPECHTVQTIYDHREREWRHLDTCQLQTRLHARVPRVDCPTHGVLQSPVAWATPGSKFTLLFERLAIDWLREAAVTAVARQLQLGWGAVWGMERRAVARGLERRGTLTLRHVGVDEKSFQRRHDYVTVVSDLAGARVLFVADDRKREDFLHPVRLPRPLLDQPLAVPDHVAQLALRGGRHEAPQTLTGTSKRCHRPRAGAR